MPIRPESVRPLLCGLLALALTACGSGAKEADKAIEAKVLLVGNQAEPKTLDVQLSSGVPEARVQKALCEGLTQLDAEDDGKVAPGAAASWEPSDDYRTWTFHLQPGGNWSDGTPVTAQDFVYSYERILSPALGAQYAEMLYLIDGAEQFSAGKTDDFTTVAVKALDEKTLEFQLVGSTPYFPDLIRHHSYFPVPKRAIEANGAMTDRGNDWASPGKFVCNGPFKLKEWRTNQLIEVERNPEYWDAKSVKLNGIRFFPIENAQTETAMFMGRQLHVTSAIQLGKYPTLKQTHPAELHSDAFLAVVYVGVNTKRSALKDPRVREALSLAIDRRSLVENVLKAGQIPASGFVPSALSGYPASDKIEFDVAKAQRLLAEAGYPGGKGFPALEILNVSSDDNRKLGEVIQGMWKQNLGIEMGIYNQEWKVYLDRLQSEDYDVALQSWLGDYAYATTFLELYTSGSGNNHTGWHNAEFDGLIARARRAATEEERIALLKQAEDLIMTDRPTIPLYWPRRNYLVDPRVKGVIPRALGMHSWKDFYF